MPFRSLSQQRLLFSKHPDVAESFDEKTPKSLYKKLPEHISDKNRLKEYTKKHKGKKYG